MKTLTMEEMKRRHELTEAARCAREYVVKLRKQVEAFEDDDLIEAARHLKRTMANFDKVLVEKGLGG